MATQRVDPGLDITGDPVDLTRALCDIESVSGNEGRIADAVEAALGALPHLSVERHGDAVVARTGVDRPGGSTPSYRPGRDMPTDRPGRGGRVLLAGHLDTVPLSAAGNLPTWVQGEGADQLVFGRGTCDMKSGVAVQLALAGRLAEPAREVTYVFYDAEEVEAERNGLGRIARTAPDLLAADFAVLLEPSNGKVEGGCNGTIRVQVLTKGLSAHSARAWMGHNAIHDAGPVLEVLRGYQPEEVDVEGLRYRECLNAVRVEGGVAGNVIPDRCVVTVNYRFAPSKTPTDAEAYLREIFAGYEVVVTDVAAGARPGLDRPMAREFVAAIGTGAAPKYGWTDVARFSELGVPAVNYGPGDPLKAHADDEHVPAQQIRDCLAGLLRWLT
jgi:succinyl-diaminopimelate desuccinylase